MFSSSNRQRMWYHVSSDSHNHPRTKDVRSEDYSSTCIFTILLLPEEENVRILPMPMLVESMTIRYSISFLQSDLTPCHMSYIPTTTQISIYVVNPVMHYIYILLDESPWSSPSHVRRRRLWIEKCLEFSLGSFYRLLCLAPFLLIYVDFFHLGNPVFWSPGQIL